MKRFNNRKKIKINKETRSEYNFKEVALTKMAKRQLFVTLFSILGVTIISLGSAYAVFTSVSKSADYNVIKVGTLNIDFGEDSSNTIDLSGQYPMSDEEGLTLTPYTFTITNTGTLSADYEVFIQDDQDMIKQDNCPPEIIELKVYGTKREYIRSLPLHHSQEEIESGKDWAVFRYYVAPTYDFIQEILSHGYEVEIIAPAHLKEEIRWQAAIVASR